MSFGFSVGDLIGAANLTYCLINALHGSHDAGQDYREAIEELGAFQQALMRVSCLGSNKIFPRATFEWASCIIMGSMDIIQKFLDRTKKYDRKLGKYGLPTGRAGFAQSWRKIGWTLLKVDDMKKLRKTLHARLSALGVLLAAVNLDTDTATTQIIDNSQNGTSVPDSEANTIRLDPQAAATASQAKYTTLAHWRPTHHSDRHIPVDLLPFPLTWVFGSEGMEGLIKQAFIQVEVIGEHVHAGHYDLVGRDGEIILPQVWETMIQPDWAITMHM